MALPLEDSLIAQLQPAARRAIGVLWQQRGASELRVGGRFSLLAAGCAGHSATDDLRARLELAATDEARHAQLCEEVGEHYTPRSEPLSQSECAPLVRFGDADAQLSWLLHLVLLSCINEGVSTFYLRDAMKHSRSPLARAALRQLLADDVQHARIGWQWLASPAVKSAEKRVIAAALPTLLSLSHESWTSVATRDEPWFIEHGCPGVGVARRAFVGALSELVLPGLTHVGVDPAPAALWADALAR